MTIERMRAEQVSARVIVRPCAGSSVTLLGRPAGPLFIATIVDGDGCRGPADAAMCATEFTIGISISRDTDSVSHPS